MFKNPRGLCLIVNIYQIDGMPPRRWSNKDSETLKQLFEQLLFSVKMYTDSTHDLSYQVRKSFFLKLINYFNVYSKNIKYLLYEIIIFCYSIKFIYLLSNKLRALKVYFKSFLKCLSIKKLNAV